MWKNFEVSNTVVTVTKQVRMMNRENENFIEILLSSANKDPDKGLSEAE